MKYEGINFNSAHYASKSEKEFIDHEKHHFEGDVNAVKKLKEAYALIQKEAKPGKKKASVSE